MKTHFTRLSLAIVLLFIFLNLKSQTNAYRNAINPVFQSLNKTEITTDLLWDYGVNLSGPQKFNGTLNTSNYLTKTE